MKENNTTYDELAIMIKEGFDNVDICFNKIDDRLNNIETRLDNIDAILESMQRDIEDIKKRLNNLEKAFIEDSEVNSKDVLRIIERVRILEQQVKILQQRN